MVTYTGIPKASYYAMSFVYRFTRRILKQGENYIVGKIDNGYEILIYNMQFYREDYKGNDPTVISFTNRYNVFSQVPDLDCHIELPGNGGTWHIFRAEISREHGSSYDTWVQMGSPGDMSPELSRYLSQMSAPRIQFETILMAGDIILDEIVEPHGVLFIRISSAL